MVQKLKMQLNKSKLFYIKTRRVDWCWFTKTNFALLNTFYNLSKYFYKHNTLGRLQLIVYMRNNAKRIILYTNIVQYFISFLIIIAQCNFVNYISIYCICSLRVCIQRHGNMACNRSSFNAFIFNKLDFNSSIHYNRIHVTTNQLPSKLFGSLNLGGLWYLSIYCFFSFTHSFDDLISRLNRTISWH